MHFKLSRYVIISDPIEGGSAADLSAKRMIFSTRKGMGIVVTNYLVSILNQSDFELIPDHMFNILMYHEILVPEEEEEFESLLTQKNCIAQDTKCLEIIIKIAGDQDLNDIVVKKLNDLLVTDSEYLKNNNHRIIIDIDAPDIEELTAHYLLVDNLLAEHNFLQRLNIECVLKCRSIGKNYNFSVSEKKLAISSLHLLVDQNDVSPISVQYLDTILGNLNDAQANIYLIIKEGQLDSINQLNNIFEYLSLRKKTIRTIVLPFGLSREDIGQKSILKHLSKEKYNFDFLPLPGSNYYSNKTDNQVYPTGATFEFINQWFKDEEVAQKKILPLFTNSYDADITDILRNKVIKCNNCVYWPMCGGHINKNNYDDNDCPEFVTNFLDKAKLKYGIAI